MAHSSYRLDLVIVADANGNCSWTTPSRAARMCAVDPRLEIIDEAHPAYAEYLKVAGPKPTVIIFAKEEYGAKD